MTDRHITLPKESSGHHLHIGSCLIQLFKDSTGLIELTREKAKAPYIVSPTHKALNFTKRVNGDLSVCCPVYGPILTMPKPWRSIHQGGFHEFDFPFIRNVSAHHLDKLSSMLNEATSNANVHRSPSSPIHPQVFKAINALQETPYCINTRVLDVTKTLWERGLSVKLDLAGLPERYDLRIHERSTQNDPEARHAKTKNRDLLYQNIRINVLLATAERYRKAQAFYFVHAVDFRGRAYPVTSYLSPQGNDLNKGLLTFGQSMAKPLGHEGVKWLAIHGANCYGVNNTNFKRF